MDNRRGIMRGCTCLIVLALLASTVFSAVPDRIDSLAERLVRTAEDLAAESYAGFRERDRGNRADVEALFLVQQFSAGASLFRRMVQDRRPDSELRDSLSILQDQIRGSNRFGFSRQVWQNMGRTLDDISRELGASRGRSDDYQPQPADRIISRMHWRGTVDDSVQIVVQGSNANARVIQGAQMTNPYFNFTSPLPRRSVMVELKKLKGRGTVEVIQQPARSNDFTAVIQILDTKGGADEYEFEILW
jgi:hypothetical protein